MLLNVGDVIELRKTHPCGEKNFRILRVGSDIRIRCIGCLHELTLPRVKLEKMIRKITPAEKE